LIHRFVPQLQYYLNAPDHRSWQLSEEARGRAASRRWNASSSSSESTSTSSAEQQAVDGDLDASSSSAASLPLAATIAPRQLSCSQGTDQRTCRWCWRGQRHSPDGAFLCFFEREEERQKNEQLSSLFSPLSFHKKNSSTIRPIAFKWLGVLARAPGALVGTAGRGRAPGRSRAPGRESADGGPDRRGGGADGRPRSKGCRRRRRRRRLLPSHPHRRGPPRSSRPSCAPSCPLAPSSSC